MSRFAIQDSKIQRIPYNLTMAIESAAQSQGQQLSISAISDQRPLKRSNVTKGTLAVIVCPTQDIIMPSNKSANPAAAAAFKAHQRQKQQRSFFSPGTKLAIRVALLSLAVPYFLERNFKVSDYLFPWGTPLEYDRPLEYKPIDYANDLLQIKHGKTKKIVERLDEGEGQVPLVKRSETVVFDPKGTLYLMTEDAKLVKLSDYRESDDENATVTAKATYVRDLGAGRPLGGKFTPDGKALYIADGLLGLVRIRDPIEDPSSKLEVVLSSVTADDGSISRISFADDVAVGPKSGKVYFSDASDIAPDRIGTAGVDCMHASKVDVIRGGKGTGRIIEYDPKTDKTRILAKDLFFANGVAVDRDETFVLFAESFGVNLYKYHLKGDKKDTLEVVVASRDLPGIIDGVDCSWSPADSPAGNKCYAVFVTAVLPLVRLVFWLPDSLSILIRSLLMMLPRSLAPETERYGAILELDTQTNEFRLIQDPTGKDIYDMTGVTEHGGKLYLASIKHNHLGVYSLE